MIDIYGYDARRESIGERIKTLRKAHKYTQTDLAWKLSEIIYTDKEHPIGQTTIASWEKGDTLPPLGRLIALSIIFNCDVSYLLCDYDIENQNIEYIKKTTGLSESAINALQKCDKNVVDFISFLLESGTIVPTGLKVSQCIDTKLAIKHYQADVLPKLSIPAKLEKKAINEWDFSDKYLDIEEKRTKVMDELKRLDTEYTALLWRCNQGIGAAIDTFIDKEVEKYG